MSAGADGAVAEDDGGVRTPFLSVTVLNYNYAHFLPTCLDSILRQTMTDFELILINDCSTDNSLDVIKPYLDDERVILVDHATNAGFVSSLLEGCALSRGKYLTVISADDLALSDRAFEVARAVVDKCDGISLCYSAWEEVDGNGTPTFLRRAAAAGYVSSGLDELKRLLHSSSILHTGTWIARSAYQHLGGYDYSLRFAVDNNMWMALCTTGKVAYIDEVLYGYRSHGANMSSGMESFSSTTEEMLKGIDDALDRVDLRDLPDREQLRKHAKKRTLVTIPTVDIFSGNYRRGWKGYFLAAKQHPVDTTMQPRTLVLVARTLLGARGFAVVRRLRPERNTISTAVGK